MRPKDMKNSNTSNHLRLIPAALLLFSALALLSVSRPWQESGTTHAEELPSHCSDITGSEL